ncbi:MAG TPA: hypothetical protein VMX75_15645 [Spirochaetia bacterium]|nr:hypothetical protein [Spirochaetia bacterium]
MSGLYQKAVEIKKKFTPLRLVSADEIEPREDEDFSADEKEKILSQIDETIQKNKLEIGPKTFDYSPKRSGVSLPVIINVCAIALVAASLFLIPSIFNRREQSIVSDRGAILTAESKLIQALKQESEQQLQQKEQEIRGIQTRLEEMSQEREQLKAKADTEIALREQQLKKELEEAIAAERERLQREGVAAAVIEQRLQEYERTIQRENEEQLSALKEQSEAELAQKEATIASLIGEYERSLQTARNERLALEQDLKSRQAELEQQFQRKESELEGARAGALNELTTLQNQQQREQLVLDQILASYDRVNERLQASQYREALDNLENLKTFINQEPARSLPGIRKRRPVELFIIGSLEDLIAEKQAENTQDISSLIASSNRLNSALLLVEQGNGYFRDRNLAAARDSYRKAIQSLPPIEEGFRRLEEIDNADEQQKNQRIAGLLAEADRLYRSREFQPSINRYRTALEYLTDDREATSRMTSQIADAGNWLASEDDRRQLAALGAELDRLKADRETLLKRLEEIRIDYKKAAVQREGSSPELSPQMLSSLLEAKILVRKIISSEPVRSQHPELYQLIDRYFEVYGQEKQRDGSAEAVRDIDSLIGSVSKQGETGKLPEILYRDYWKPGEENLLIGLLDRIQALLR